MPYIASNIEISEALLRAVFGTAVDGIVVTDEKGIVRLYNPACERLFGYSPSEVLGRNVKLLMPREYRDEHDGYLEAYRTTGKARIIGIGRDVTGQRKDGSRFPIGLSIGEARYGKRRYFVGIMRDISEQKLSEQRLRAARDEAESASRAKSDFLAVMSHEIRTPLHGIMGTTSLLQRTGLKPKQRRYADTIEQSCHALLEIVNNILDLSRVESGAVDVKQTRFGPRNLLESVAALWQPRIRAKGLEYVTEIAPDVPRALTGDADRMREILNNLVSNAVRFTDSGYIAITASVDDPPKTGKTGHVILRFEVADTGIGIDPKDQTHLFGRFEQADTSLTRRHGGSGLGLAICKELIRLLGGEIGVDSALGRGSRFWFTIPCLMSRAVPPKSRQRRRNPRRAPEASPMTILVAEDNRDNQIIIRDILVAAGHHVDIVDNGHEAVRAVRPGKYDVILMDVRMPVMDGFEATRKIRAKLNGDRRVRIIALTAHAMRGVREQCLAAGMDDYITKPFTIDRIHEALTRCCAAA